MKRTLITLLFISLTGCTAFETKLDRYRTMADKFLNSDDVKLYYWRSTEGNQDTYSGAEVRCFGQGCKQLMQLIDSWTMQQNAPVN